MTLFSILPLLCILTGHEWVDIPATEPSTSTLSAGQPNPPYAKVGKWCVTGKHWHPDAVEVER